MALNAPGRGRATRQGMGTSKVGFSEMNWRSRGLPHAKRFCAVPGLVLVSPYHDFEARRLSKFCAVGGASLSRRWATNFKNSSLHPSTSLSSSASSTANRFRQIFQAHHIPATPLEKLHLAVWSGFGALRDPTQGHLVACLGDVLSHHALARLHDEMRSDREAREVLTEKPLIDDIRAPREQLRLLPDGTVGREYARFMDIYGFHASEREAVHFEEDEELAYVLTRYRQLHDLMHTMFGMGISVEAEVALKAIELIHTRLPVTFFSSLLGPLAVPLLRHGDSVDFAQRTDKVGVNGLDSERELRAMLTPRKVLLQSLLPWAIRVGSRMTRPLHCVYVERWFEKPLEELRRHCGVTETVPEFLLPYTRISVAA